MTWTPPWTKGLPQARCVGCGDACVARTLSDRALCVMCVKKPPAAMPLPGLELVGVEGAGAGA